MRLGVNKKKISNRTFLFVLLAVQALFLFDTLKIVSAITEDENEVSLRDVNSSRERPRLDGFDMDEDV
jgi:hypothetical protein